MENSNSATKDRELVLTRLLDAPVDLVWEVWTNPEHIANWWGPIGFTNTITTMDLVPGGAWNLIMHGPDGRNYDNQSVFMEVVLHKKIVYEHVSYPPMLVTVEFEARGEETFIRWHMLFESAGLLLKVIKAFNAAEGQKQNLEKLTAYLKNTLPGPGFKKQPVPEIITGYKAVNGLKMYYEIHGQGEMPLVLIHGGGSTIETSFGRVLPAMAKTRKIIAVELQAHGHTSDRDTPESFKTDANDVAELLRLLNVEKADVLGYSDGGCTAMQLGMDHPGLVNKLIVISGSYKKDGMVPGFNEGFKTATLANMPTALKTAYLKVAPDPQGLQTMFEKDVARRVAFPDLSEEDLGRIKAETLVMAADKDVVRTEHTVDMSKAIPNARLVILPGTHGSMLGCAEVAESKEASPTIISLAINLILSFL